MKEAKLYSYGVNLLVFKEETKWKEDKGNITMAQMKHSTVDLIRIKMFSHYSCKVIYKFKNSFLDQGN